MLHACEHLGCCVRVAVEQAFAGIAVKLLTVVRAACAHPLLRLVLPIEGDAARLQQSLRVVQELREVLVDAPYFLLCAEALVRCRQFLRWQHAHHRVLRHGAQ